MFNKHAEREAVTVNPLAQGLLNPATGFGQAISSGTAVTPQKRRPSRLPRGQNFSPPRTEVKGLGQGAFPQKGKITVSDTVRGATNPNK